MATTVRASAIGAAASGTAITVARPTGTVTGDLVIVVVHQNDAIAATCVDNNGGTPFTKDYEKVSAPGVNPTCRLAVFSRRIQAGDPATYAFTASASDRWTAVAVTFQDPHASTIYNIAPADGNTAQDTATGANLPDCISITTTTDNAIHCAVILLDGPSATVTSTPAGYTVQQNGGDQMIGFATKTITTAGATGAQSWSHTSNNARALSFAIESSVDSVGHPTMRRWGGVAPMGSGGSGRQGGGGARGAWGHSRSGAVLIPRWLADEERRAA